MNGYEALRGRSAWFDTSSRGRISAKGEDRARLLHAMSTNNVQALPPGQGHYAFFLSAQGRILADAAILARGEEILLDTEPETREKLFQHLDKFIIADDVALEDTTAATASVDIAGPQSEARLRETGAPVPEDRFAHLEWGGRTVVKLDEEHFRVITFQGDADLTARLGEEADLEAANVVRLERGRPRYGDDITERHLLQETRQMHAVNFSKGCYVGQEIVERVRSRGQVHKGLYPISVASEIVPAPGTALIDAAGAKCGETMSAAYSPALGHVVAMAYLRLPLVESMTLDGSAVTVRV
ncbi:MAG: glycine cleavage T C-terminal barrel domain-containing protein [Bryobacteraceae bacterium]|nr:glycine cleavage T C-terminal barrel domain-containing protein [Bryobacteraceae bacterium]